jgi:hypothetical protein
MRRRIPNWRAREYRYRLTFHIPPVSGVIKAAKSCHPGVNATIS